MDDYCKTSKSPESTGFSFKETDMMWFSSNGLRKARADG